MCQESLKIMWNYMETEVIVNNRKLILIQNYGMLVNVELKYDRQNN